MCIKVQELYLLKERIQGIIYFFMIDLRELKVILELLRKKLYIEYNF